MLVSAFGLFLNDRRSADRADYFSGAGGAGGAPGIAPGLADIMAASIFGPIASLASIAVLYLPAVISVASSLKALEIAGITLIIWSMFSLGSELRSTFQLPSTFF